MSPALPLFMSGIKGSTNWLMPLDTALMVTKQPSTNSTPPMAHLARSTLSGLTKCSTADDARWPDETRNGTIIGRKANQQQKESKNESPDRPPKAGSRGNHPPKPVASRHALLFYSLAGRERVES